MAYRKTRTRDPCGTIEKPENRDPSGTLEKSENQDPSGTLENRDPTKTRKPGTGTSMGPSENLKSGTRYRSGALRLEKLVLM